MRVAIFGAGDMAERGFQPVLENYGHEVLQIPHSTCDVRIPGDVESKMKVKPDVVIVTAGVSHPLTVEKSIPSFWKEELDTHALGSYNVAHSAVKHGVKIMIFLSSVAGLYGKPRHSGYSASKGAVRSLVQSLGMEGHEAYSISPGRVDTRMRQRDYPKDTEGSRLEPREVGEVVLDIINDKYLPGDNVVIRRVGFDTQAAYADTGQPWRTELKVGEPITI